MEEDQVYQAVIETHQQREENLRMSCLHLALETSKQSSGYAREEVLELAKWYFKFVKGE